MIESRGEVQAANEERVVRVGEVENGSPLMGCALTA